MICHPPKAVKHLEGSASGLRTEGPILGNVGRNAAGLESCQN